MHDSKFSTMILIAQKFIIGLRYGQWNYINNKLHWKCLISSPVHKLFYKQDQNTKWTTTTFKSNKNLIFTQFKLQL